MAEKITEVILLSVPLKSDGRHTLYFASRSDQETYFKSKKIGSFDYNNFSYQRKDQLIRVPAMYDDIATCNYVMYRNTAYTDKWFYAFVTDLKYVDDGRTDIYIKTDAIQTWLFDYTVKTSFVEREHVIDDTIGANTVPEGLETGEYKCDASNSNTPLMNSYCIVVGSTVNLSQLTSDRDKCDPISGGRYNGIYSGVAYYAFDNNYNTVDVGETHANGGIQALNQALKYLADMGQSDAIVSMFLAPKNFIQLGEYFTVSYASGDMPMAFRMVMGGEDYITKQWSPVTTPSDVDGYVPKNKKVFTYPYQFLLVSNNAGGSAVYEYEKFKNRETPSFDVSMAITPGCSVRLVPKNYGGVAVNNEEGLTGGKYPVCSWTNDVYTNWLTQNSVNIGIQLAGGVAQIVGGIAASVGTGGAGTVLGAGSVVGGVSSIASTLGQVHQQSLTPPQAEGNLNSGDVSFSMGYLTFTAYRKTIKAEYAKIIDSYFHQFGYKVNRLKVPNYNHRGTFWFTKTIDVNIDGSVPESDMQSIKDRYNTGITFWRSANFFLYYDSGNGIFEGAKEGYN